MSIFVEGGFNPIRRPSGVLPTPQRNVYALAHIVNQEIRGKLRHPESNPSRTSGFELCSASETLCPIREDEAL